MCQTIITAVCLWLAVVLASPVRAQDHTVTFSVGDAGVSKAITNWGLDTGWANYDNMRRGLIFMGTNTVNLVQVAFEMFDVVTNDITPQMKLDLTNMVNLAYQTSTNARWILSSGTGGGVTNFYQSGIGTVYPDRWVTMMSAWQRNYKTNFPGRTMWLAQPFNEPDWGWGQGSQQNLYDILGYLQASNNFAGVNLGGGCTLDCGAAASWYDFINARVTVGSTHCLNGTAYSFVSFIQDVAARGDIPYASEVHNLGEVIIGANYGVQAGTWWGTAELARGNFANACQGRRLGYAEDLNNFTASAVYRGTNGAVQIFLGGDERHGTATSYRFFAKDRDVFYNGDGPRRDYTTTNSGSAEEVVNVAWGADVPPPISGRYIVVNHNSGKVLEVPGANTNWGVQLDQGVYTGASNQLWDVYPVGGGCYSLLAAHNGAAINLYYNGYNPAGSYDNGDAVLEWGTGGEANSHWYFQYTTNGYFKIRSGWSNKVLGVNGASTASGAVILQWDDNGTTDHEWRFLPVGAAVEFVAPAAPALVTASANAASVQLNWKTNSESDLAGYTVLRGTNSGGPYEVAARGLTNAAFTDKSANRLRPYFYVVKAVDRSLNISGNSAQVSATPTGYPSVIARYAFDGNFNDSSGNANHPIILTGSPALVAGKIGSALNLNGTSQYVNLPAGLFAAVSNFTIAAWVYWNGGAAWQRIFDFGNDTTQYMFLTPNSGSGLRFAINSGGGEQQLNTATLPSNQWVHVAVTLQGNIGSLYTNGVLATSGSIAINPASFNPALNYLGKSQFPDPLFSGSLDELLVANYAMSSAQIAWLPVNSAPLPVLAHRYSFTGDASDLVGGAAWNGTLPNGGTFGGGQLTLNSAGSQYVSLPANILGNYAAVTIEAWATFPNAIAWNTMFFSFGKTNGPDGNNYLSCSPQGGRITLTSTNYNGEQNAYSGIDFSFHTNLHLAAVFNPAGNELRLYTNGILAGVNTGVTTPLTAVSNVFSYIGRSLYSGDVYFNFSLDEFRIYNGVMQPADVAAAQLAGPNVLLTTNATLYPSRIGGYLALSWPLAVSGFTLVSSPVLGGGAVWTPVPGSPSILGGNNQLTITPANGTVFFRLQR